MNLIAATLDISADADIAGAVDMASTLTVADDLNVDSVRIHLGLLVQTVVVLIRPAHI